MALLISSPGDTAPLLSELPSDLRGQHTTPPLLKSCCLSCSLCTFPLLENKYSIGPGTSVLFMVPTSEYLIDLDITSHVKDCRILSPFPFLPRHPTLVPMTLLLLISLWATSSIVLAASQSNPQFTTSHLTLFCLFCDNLRLCFPLLDRLGTTSFKGSDTSQERRKAKN